MYLVLVDAMDRSETNKNFEKKKNRNSRFLVNCEATDRYSNNNW